MKYMLMFVSDDTRWEQQDPETRKRAYAEIGTWWEEHSKAGRIVGGEELKSTKTATTVRKVDGRITVTDGPFIEAKESIGGYAIVNVPDLDAALALAKTWPVLSTLEVRPIVESRD